jgi:hypothetical protein
MSGIPWITITGSVLDDWTYWSCYYNYTYLQSFITAHNRWLPNTHSIPSSNTSAFSSTVTDLHEWRLSYESFSANELRILSQLGADWKQITPLKISSVIICVYVIVGMLTETLSENGLFRLSDFLIHSLPCKRASTPYKPRVKTPLPRSGLFSVATGMYVYRTVA